MPDEINEPVAEDIEKNKQATIFNQVQAGYVTLSEIDGKACANCIFFRDTGYDGIEYQHCHLVEAWPAPILPTGYCNEWRAVPEPPADMTEQITDAVAGAVSDAVEIIADTLTVSAETPKKPLLQRAKDALFPARPLGTFDVFKGTNGKWYWIAKHTNAYEDRDGEILAEKAHEAYIKRLDMKLVPMPELWTWHLGEKTKHGAADTVFGIGRIVVAVGHFDDTPIAEKAISFYRKNKGKVKLSHGFTAPEWALKDGIYEVYNTFEISTLPPEAAANPYTSFEEVQTMKPDPKKLSWVGDVLGKEVADRLVAETEQHDKALTDLNVRYKDFADVTRPAGADPAKNKEADADMANAFVSLVETQGEILRQLTAQAARQDALESANKAALETNAAYEKEVGELRKLVNAGPRRPSQDGKTEIADEIAKELTDKLPTDNGFDSFFGDMKIKKVSSN